MAAIQLGAQRRRIADLYSNGELVTLGDGPEAEKVWIRKMTPADNEIAYLKASARRASILAAAQAGEDGEHSELYEMLKTEVNRLKKDDLAEWLTDAEMVEVSPIIDARLAAEEEWSKDRYLAALRERFSEDDFQTKVEEFPDDPEVERVLDELTRFQALVTKEEKEARDGIYNDFAVLSLEELREKVMDSMLEVQGNAAWLAEFAKCQIWLCTREGDNHLEKVWPKRQDLEEVQTEVIAQLKEAIDRIHVSDAEGKDSGQTPPSSPPSE